jgi:hypothetical protein
MGPSQEGKAKAGFHPDAHKTAEAGGLTNIDLQPPVFMLSMYASAQNKS